jgi:hypothetical protein
LPWGGRNGFIVGRTHRPDTGNTDRHIDRNAQHHYIAWYINAQVVSRERKHL